MATDPHEFFHRLFGGLCGLEVTAVMQLASATNGCKSAAMGRLHQDAESLSFQSWSVVVPFTMPIIVPFVVLLSRRVEVRHLLWLSLLSHLFSLTASFISMSEDIHCSVHSWSLRSSHFFSGLSLLLLLVPYNNSVRAEGYSDVLFPRQWLLLGASGGFFQLAMVHYLRERFPSGHVQLVCLQMLQLVPFCAQGILMTALQRLASKNHWPTTGKVNDPEVQHRENRRSFTFWSYSLVHFIADVSLGGSLAFIFQVCGNCFHWHSWQSYVFIGQQTDRSTTNY